VPERPRPRRGDDDNNNNSINFFLSSAPPVEERIHKDRYSNRIAFACITRHRPRLKRGGPSLLLHHAHHKVQLRIHRRRQKRVRLTSGRLGHGCTRTGRCALAGLWDYQFKTSLRPPSSAAQWIQLLRWRWRLPLYIYRLGCIPENIAQYCNSVRGCVLLLKLLLLKYYYYYYSNNIYILLCRWTNIISKAPGRYRRRYVYARDVCDSVGGASEVIGATRAYL